jgi:hypothetical protein
MSEKFGRIGLIIMVSGAVILLIFQLVRFIQFESSEKANVCAEITKVSTAGQAGVTVHYKFYLKGVKYESYDVKSGRLFSFPYDKGDLVYIEYVVDDPEHTQIVKYGCTE